MLITVLVKKTNELVPKKLLLVTIILLIAFVPVSWNYMKKADKIHTQITVHIMNHSEMIAENIMVYGIGNIFENCDTLTILKLNPGEDFKYLVHPLTKPARVGHIQMDFQVKITPTQKLLPESFPLTHTNCNKTGRLSLIHYF